MNFYVICFVTTKESGRSEYFKILGSLSNIRNIFRDIFFSTKIFCVIYKNLDGNTKRSNRVCIRNRQVKGNNVEDIFSINTENRFYQQI